ncbi:hypothetical protein D3C77_723390 [compost metagenome]
MRHLEKVIGGALTGAGIDLATMPLHITHQAIVERETLIAEKQQVLKKVREPRVGVRGVMTAGHDPHGGRATL